ncbi:MAG: hypothetical protein HUU57_00030 [Bdellovibrio sp.]|nr:hypothetical protein [Bdellovibrio sp.]
MAVTPFEFLESLDFSFIVAVDIPFGEVLEGFSLVLHFWTMVAPKLDDGLENKTKNAQKPKLKSSPEEGLTRQKPKACMRERAIKAEPSQ